MGRTAALATTAVVVAVVYLLGIAQGWHRPLAWISAAVLLATLTLVAVSARTTRVRQERLFVATYGSLDGARDAMDLDALRASRDADGVVATVRTLRRSHPAIPLAEAAEIVRAL